MNLEQNSWHCNFYSYFYDRHQDNITTNGCKYLRNLIIAILTTVIFFPLWMPSLFVKNMMSQTLFAKIGIGSAIWLGLYVIVSLCFGITSLWIVYKPKDSFYFLVISGQILWFYTLVGGFLFLFTTKFLPWLVIKIRESKLSKINLSFIGKFWRNISDKICFKINWTKNKE
jgi:hypothetical protein